MREMLRWALLGVLAVLVVTSMLRHRTMVVRHRTLVAQYHALEATTREHARQLQDTARLSDPQAALVQVLLEQTETVLRHLNAPHRANGRWMAGDCSIPWDGATWGTLRVPAPVLVVTDPTPPVQVEARSACPVPVHALEDREWLR